MSLAASIGWIDLVVLATSLVAAIGIGLGLRGRSRTLDAYALADRNLPWWAVLGSIVATETSTVTVLSVPGLGFGITGMRFLQLSLGYIVGRTLVARFLLPLYFDGRLMTAYEVLGRRFGPKATKAGALLFLVARNLGDGLRLFLTAVVVEQLVGWPFGWSVVAIGAVTLVYTYLGGMRSVVWNDCLQLAIYMIGAVGAVFVIASMTPGGWPEVWRFAAESDRLRVIDSTLSWTSPYTLWAGVVGGAFLTMGTHGTDQMMVQRYLSARSLRDASRALVSSGFVVMAQFAIFLFIGIELAAYYSHHPEVVSLRPDFAFSHFIVNVFPRNTGLVGLMIAAILAAAMSTLSSSLNSSAATLVHDFSLAGCDPAAQPDRAVALTRRFTIVFAIVQMAIGYAAAHLTGAVVDNTLTIAGFAAGLLLGVYALGLFTPRASAGAALTGAMSGLVALVLLHFVAPALGWPRLAFPWLAVAGASITLMVGTAVKSRWTA